MSKNFEKKEITKKSKNISKWYNDVVLKAELADYGPAKGTIIFRPYGYKIWEKIQKYLDARIFEELDAQNAYFPLFIPESLLKREKEHLEGFSPELAVVTIAGGEKLSEPLVVRPTSETIICDAFSRWIQSYRDLPLKINQWANVVRWEKRPYVFLRNTEFLWQEGHTAHTTHKEAQATVQMALNVYKDFYTNVMAIYGILGKKSESEKFAGADETYTFEMLMPDRKALQGCTSHDLGQNFSKVFKIEFQDASGKNQHVWQTTWGFSTRSLGALVMVHGDDDGLVLPSKIAPIKMVIVPVLGKDDEKVLGFCQKVKSEVEKHIKNTEFDGEVQVWDRPEKTPGWKANETELKGICLATRVGPEEVKGNGIALVTRLSAGAKDQRLTPRHVKLEEIGKSVLEMLQNLQNYLLEKSRKFTEENTRSVETYEEFKKIMATKRGFILTFWCENSDCETKIKEETKATTRCLPLDSIEEKGSCIYCGKFAKHRWLFAQAY